MKQSQSKSLPQFHDLAKAIAEARQITKVPAVFSRRASVASPTSSGEIRVLRRWNSHTPSLVPVYGGGYFLRWMEHGTVIDPGCSFLRVLDRYTDYGLGDINMVIATHDHVDHSQDLLTLISLLRQYNKWRVSEGEKPHLWDLLVSHGVADQFAAVFDNPENAPFLQWCRALPPKDIEKVRNLPTFDFGGGRKDTSKWPIHLRGLWSHSNRKVSSKLKYALSALPTIHKELLGDRTGMGLRFALNKVGTDAGRKVLVISGDTAFDSSLVHQYRGANLLILHVGTMENPDGQRLKGEHLGMIGVVDILQALAPSPPELVVLTEWGYEFGRIGLQGRSRFTIGVAHELRNRGCDRYFAAVQDAASQDGGIPVIPADLSLRISLPHLEVWSEEKVQGKEKGFVKATDIRAHEIAERIEFR